MKTKILADFQICISVPLSAADEISTAEFAEFNSKIELNATYLCHHFTEPHNCQI